MLPLKKKKVVFVFAGLFCSDRMWFVKVITCPCWCQILEKPLLCSLSIDAVGEKKALCLFLFPFFIWGIFIFKYYTNLSRSFVDRVEMLCPSLLHKCSPFHTVFHMSCWIMLLHLHFIIIFSLLKCVLYLWGYEEHSSHTNTVKDPSGATEIEPQYSDCRYHQCR